jgi:hypothetical protein
MLGWICRCETHRSRGLTVPCKFLHGIPLSTFPYSSHWASALLDTFCSWKMTISVPPEVALPGGICFPDLHGHLPGTQESGRWQIWSEALPSLAIKEGASLFHLLSLVSSRFLVSTYHLCFPLHCSQNSKSLTDIKQMFLSCSLFMPQGLCATLSSEVAGIWPVSCIISDVMTEKGNVTACTMMQSLLSRSDLAKASHTGTPILRR